MIAGIDREFREFARRFVLRYWEDVAHGAAEFSDHREPNERFSSQLVSDIVYETFCRQTFGSRLCTLRMVNRYGDAWRFMFRPVGAKWILIRATSGSEENDARIDLLDDDYVHRFRPFLDRIISRALNDD